MRIRICLSLLVLSLFVACKDTSLNDTTYSGAHDDTLGIHNEANYPPAPAPTGNGKYEEAGPTAKEAYTADSRPTQSNGGAGLTWEIPAPTLGQETASTDKQ